MGGRNLTTEIVSFSPLFLTSHSFLGVRGAVGFPSLEIINKDIKAQVGIRKTIYQIFPVIKYKCYTKGFIKMLSIIGIFVNKNEVMTSFGVAT